MNTFNTKTFGYNFAKAGDNTKALAREFHSMYPSFPENVPDEVTSDLNSGAFLRYAENNTSKEGYYILNGSSYEVTTKEAFEKSKGDKVHLTVAFATALTSQAFGALRTKNPALHALINPLRKGALEYAKAKMNALRSEIHKIVNEGKPRERGVTKSFAETIEDMFEGKNGLKAKVKSALARGDDTANETKLRNAIAKFKAEYFGAGFKAKVQE